MKFNFKKRQAEYGKLNIRQENHGPEEKKNAIDLPVSFRITKKELDMVVPFMQGKLSSIMYDGKNNLLTHVLSPMTVQRKPEHLSIVIYDSETDEKKCLKFEDVKAKSIKVVFDEKAQITLTVMVQIHPGDKDYERLCTSVMGKMRKFQCESKQLELLDGENDEGEEEPEETPEE